MKGLRRIPRNPERAHSATHVLPTTTRQIRQMEALPFRLALGYGARQLASLKMHHLSGAGLQGPAHQQHLAADVGAGQQAMLPQPMAKHLLAHRKALPPSYLLGHLIAG